MDVTGRDIAALLNPRLALLVTCCDKAGKPNVLSVIWHTPLSHEPPLVGISLGLNRYSRPLISGTGEFVLNVIGQSFQTAVQVCGNNTGKNCDKIQLSGLKLEPALSVRPPIIAGCLGYLECRVVNKVECGDHELFVGRVLHAVARSGCFSNGWDPVRSDELLCLHRDHMGRFVSLK